MGLGSSHIPTLLYITRKSIVNLYYPKLQAKPNLHSTRSHNIKPTKIAPIDAPHTDNLRSISAPSAVNGTAVGPTKPEPEEANVPVASPLVALLPNSNQFADNGPPALKSAAILLTLNPDLNVLLYGKFAGMMKCAGCGYSKNIYGCPTTAGAR